MSRKFVLKRTNSHNIEVQSFIVKNLLNVKCKPL